MSDKKRLGGYIKFLVYGLAVILVNVAGITLFYRLDLTENRVYSISKASQEAVSTLSEPLTINVFFTKNLPAPHNNTERYLHDLLAEYAVYANRNFNYRFYDVSPEEGDITKEAKENQELARNYGIQPVQVQVVERDEVKFQKGYMGLVIIHGDLIERIPTITSTDGLEYQVTTAITKLNNKISALLRLKEKIHVKLFLSSSLKAVAPYMRLNNLPGLPEKLKAIVESVNDKTYGKLEYQYLDPSANPELEKDLDKYRLLKLRWPALLEGRIEAGEGVVGLAMQYGDRTVDIPILQVMQIPLIGRHYELADLGMMEQTLNDGLESLIDINQDLAYLTSHGTPRLSGPPMEEETLDAAANFRSLAAQNYTIKEGDLKEGKLPEGADALVIAGPTEPFSDYELFQIDQFLMRGKSLAVFLDAFKEAQTPGRQAFNAGNYVPNETGLEKLLAHYGLRIKNSYVMDENCYKQEVPERFGGGERLIYFAPIIKNEKINHELQFMHNIKGLVAMQVSPIEVDAQLVKQKGLTARPVFSSSDQSWEMTGRINLNPMFIRPPQEGDEKKSFPLAYVVEGAFPSYFAGKPIPEKEAEKKEGEPLEEEAAENGSQEAKKEPEVDLSKIEGEGEILSAGKPGKIFLISSSHMLRDNVLDEEGRSPNAMFVMNVLDYLNNREDISLMRSKQQRFNPLKETTGGARVFIKTFNIVGLPVLVVIFGLAVWFRRHARKKRIQAMFESSPR